MKDKYTWMGKISCQEIDNTLALDSSSIATTRGCYLYNLVLQGECFIEYNGKKLTLRKNQFSFITPAAIPKALGSTDDYKALFLVIQDTVITEKDITRKMLQTSFYSSIYNNSPTITITDENMLAKIKGDMHQILLHINHPHPFSFEAIQGIYSSLLSDLMAVLDCTIAKSNTPTDDYNTFISFTELLNNNFKTHHDIAFYANQLHISTRYLAMIIKNLTGHTVAFFINRKLLLEACWQLKSTNKSIQDISNDLNFSDQSAFCKFFKRQAGRTPLIYRKEK